MPSEYTSCETGALRPGIVRRISATCRKPGGGVATCHPVSTALASSRGCASVCQPLACAWNVLFTSPRETWWPVRSSVNPNCSSTWPFALSVSERSSMPEVSSAHRRCAKRSASLGSSLIHWQSRPRTRSTSPSFAV